MLLSLKRFSKDEVAQERLKILRFYQEFGEKATLKAFGVNRKTIWVWRKRLSLTGHLSTLVPYSTRPKTVRRMTTDERIVNYIKHLREKHPRLGKEKIKPLLDKYCLTLGIQSISVSTIGKVIKRNNLFYQKQGRIYHNPDFGWAKRKPSKRLRVRYSPKPQDFGHLQMDTILKLIDGLRVYLYSALDINLKFGLTLVYFHLNSQNALDFFKKVKLVYPAKIKSVQTDNGLEFLGAFDQYLKKENIPHYFIYPRCPRINGAVERYQRTIQEEFLDPNLDLIHQPKLFEERLGEYLLWYNTQRPHESLGLKSPMDYLVEKGGMSKMCVTHTCH